MTNVKVNSFAKNAGKRLLSMKYPKGMILNSFKLLSGLTLNFPDS